MLPKVMKLIMDRSKVLGLTAKLIILQHSAYRVVTKLCGIRAKRMECCIAPSSPLPPENSSGCK